MSNNINSSYYDRLLESSSSLFVKKNHPNNTPTNIGRLRFLAVSSYFGIAFILFLLVASNIPNHNVIGIVSDIALLTIIAGLIFCARYGGYYTLAFNLTVAMLVFILPIGYFSQAADRSLFLLPVALLYSYFLLGKKGGLWWTLVIYVVNGIALLVDKYTPAQLAVDPSYLINGSIAMFFMSLLLYTFENNNEINQRLIRKQARLLTRTNDKLQTELASRIDLTRQLQNTVQKMEKNNKQLEDSKRALLNVLEDSNELQKQLEQQKAGVEKKIELRTRQLLEEQARLHASIDTLDLGFLMTLKSGKSILHNPALRTVCSLDNNVSDDHILEALHKKLNGTFKLKQAVKKCLETGMPFSKGDIEIEGTYIRILGSAIKIKKDTEIIGVVLLVEDMSESKMLERSKDEFVSIASHELRTPLTAIRGNLSLLQMLHGDKFTDKEVSQMMDDITDAVVRLISIVNQFLTTSRLEQKKTVFELTPVDPSKAINNAINDLQSMAQESDLKLSAKLQIGLPNIMADESRLQGVLNNLIGNAIKYTDTGSIVVSAERTKDAVVVRVSDTGRGIDSKNQHLLFQKFQQATDNIFTRDDSRSTGLGLYITKLMVEQMGGEIELESSKIGKGSTFSFKLPIA